MAPRPIFWVSQNLSSFCLKVEDSSYLKITENYDEFKK